MHPATRELPDEPAFHRAKAQESLLGRRARAGHGIEDPLKLGCRKIGVDHKAGFFPDRLAQAARSETVAGLRGAAALPYDGVAYRAAGAHIPHHGGLALIGDADGGNVRGVRADVGKRKPRNLQLHGENLLGIMLHPAGPRENLREFLLRDGSDLPLPVEKNAAVAGRAGIQGHNILCHNAVPPKFQALLEKKQDIADDLHTSFP